MVIVGHGTRFEMPAVLALAERLGAPILTTFKAKGLVSDRHPLGAGVLGRSGTPVAAFPVTGPRDILAGTEGRVGAVDADLRAACLRALDADRGACRAHAERYSWRACAELFLSHLVPVAGT